IIIMGMFEISRAVMVVEYLNDAARKGCNTGIKPGKTFTDIQNDIVDVLNNDQSIACTAATISVNPSSPSTSVPTMWVATASYVTPATNPPTWGSWTDTSSNSTYTPQQFDLVKVRV